MKQSAPIGYRTIFLLLNYNELFRFSCLLENPTTAKHTPRCYLKEILSFNMKKINKLFLKYIHNYRKISCYVQKKTILSVMSYISNIFVLLYFDWVWRESIRRYKTQEEARMIYDTDGANWCKDKIFFSSISSSQAQSWAVFI